MDKARKSTLLERNFTSIEYMEEMSQYHRAAIDAKTAAILCFYEHPPLPPGLA